MTIRNKIWALLVVATFAMAACQDSAPTSDPLPYKYVYEQVFMNEARALPLNQRDGSWIYIAGGLKGIVIYRRGPGDFVAVDRQSPATGSCQCRVNITNSYIEDTCSNNTFDFTGRLLSGTSSYNLRQYQVNYDGSKILITY